MLSFLTRRTTKKRIYLDHAASTPTRPEVIRVMLPYLEESYGNPSAIHAEGREARLAIEEARGRIASVLGVKSAGIVFTSGGTEANNLAIIGYLRQLHQTGRTYESMEVVTTALEHPSISATLSELGEWGVVVKVVVVDGEGKISPSALRAQLSSKTVLCTFAYANSEVGVVQKVHALARELRTFERTHSGVKILLHLDAAQAPLWLPCDLARLDADFVTLDGAKCGGPKGIGVLVARKAGLIAPVTFGGGQESGCRPGTENVAAVVGMAEALSLAQASWRERAERVARVRDEALKLLEQLLPTAVLNGPTGEGRIANNINISLPGFDTEYAVVVLDAAGIAASTKSACAGAGGGESVVVKTITSDAARSRSTLRLTLGPLTTIKELQFAIDTLKAFLVTMGRV